MFSLVQARQPLVFGSSTVSLVSSTASPIQPYTRMYPGSLSNGELTILKTYYDGGGSPVDTVVSRPAFPVTIGNQGPYWALPYTGGTAFPLFARMTTISGTPTLGTPSGTWARVANGHPYVEKSGVGNTNVKVDFALEGNTSLILFTCNWLFYNSQF